MPKNHAAEGLTDPTWILFGNLRESLISTTSTFRSVESH